MDNSNLFKNRLEQLGIGRQVSAAMIVARTQKVIDGRFGARGRENIRVVSYRKGVLKVSTSSSAWSAECRQLTSELQQSPVTRVVFGSFDGGQDESRVG